MTVNNEKKTEKTYQDKLGKFVRGNPGRPKGAKAKIDRDIKEMILNAAYDERIGGIEGLIKFATKNDRNKALFYGWLFKMLPNSVVGAQDDKGDFHPLKVIIAKDGDGTN